MDFSFIYRWWNQYTSIPWPDPIAVFVSATVHGQVCFDDGSQPVANTNDFLFKGRTWSCDAKNNHALCLSLSNDGPGQCVTPCEKEIPVAESLCGSWSPQR